MLYISHSYGKRKCKHSVCGNLWYCMKALWEWKRAAVVMIALGFLPFLAASYGATLLPATIVNDLEAGRLFRVLALHIVVLCLFIWMGQTLDQSSMIWLERSMPGFLQHFRKKFTEKIMDLDYDLLEDKENREVIGNVAAAVRHGRGLYIVPDFLINGFASIMLLLFYGILIARIHIGLLAVVMITTGLDYILIRVARKKYGEYYGENSRYALRTDYISTQAADVSAGKDIRLYKLLGLFLSKYEESMKGWTSCLDGSTSGISFAGL